MSDLTTLEKYKQLSQLDKDTLAFSSLTDPEKTIEIADRQLEQFETVNRWTNAVVIFLMLSFIAYSFGLPKSFPGFLGGLFSFLMAGFILGVISYLLVEVLFLIITKIYFEKISNQKFKESIEKNGMI